jgi:cytochrome P450
MTSNLPPGPRGLKAYGFLGGGSAARAFAFLERTTQEHGPVSMFRILNQRICLVNDAELIKQILVTEQHKFTRDTGATLLRELVGEGLLTSEEPFHLERRRILQPAFHRAQLAGYAQLMVAESERLPERWKDGQVLDIGAEMRRVTLAIVGSALFGVDFGRDVKRIAEILRKAVRRSARLSLLTILLEPLLLAYRRRRPNAASVLFARERAELQEIIDPILRDHRTCPGRDLMSLMLDAGGLSEDEVRNETITMVLAGHETSAAALTWCFYLITTHAHVQERLRAEITRFSERPPTLDDLPALTYTSMVFRETLRLYPPALAFGRRPIADIELGGYHVPARTSVLVSPYITQRNRRYFTNADQFLPERWQSMSVPKFAYFPFGGGSKMCIGESFANLEGVLVLASLLRRWDFVCENAGQVNILPGITLGPDRNVLIRVRSRKD